MVKADPLEANLALHRAALGRVRLRAVSPEELARILAGHHLYLETNRRQGKRGNLSATDLTGMIFQTRSCGESS